MEYIVLATVHLVEASSGLEIEILLKAVSSLLPRALESATAACPGLEHFSSLALLWYVVS